MSVRVLFILLVISLVFNVAVLIGFIKTRSAAAPHVPHPLPQPQSQPMVPEGKPWLDRVVRELRLDPQQRTAVEGLQKRQQQQNSVFGDSVVVVRQDLQEEVRKAEPDLERVRSLVDQEADLVRQRRLSEAELYGEFVGLLTADQRQRLRDRATPREDGRAGSQNGRPDQRNTMGAGGGGQDGRHREANPAASPDVVRRFDRNKNGRLDPDEAKEARKDLQNRRREIAPRVSQFPPLWPWFDKDGDGELNESERIALADFLRDHRPAGAEQIRPEQLLPPSQREREGRQDGVGRRRGGGGPEVPPQQRQVPATQGQPQE